MSQAVQRSRPAQGLLLATVLLWGCAGPPRAPAGPAPAVLAAAPAERAADPAWMAAAQQAIDDDRFDDATALADTALADALRTGDTRAQSYALRVLGSVASYEGRLDEAESLLGRAASVAREHGHARELGKALVSLGLVLHTRGDTARAAALAQEGVGHLRAGGDVLQLAHALAALGTIRAESGREDEALPLYEESFALARAHGLAAAQANAATNIGAHHLHRGHYAEALRWYGDALAVRQRAAGAGSGQDELNNIGAVYWELGDRPRALQQFRAALALDRASGAVLNQIDDLNNIGTVLSDLGQYAEAEAALRESLELARVADYPLAITYALKNLGDLQRRSGHPELALASHRAAIEASVEASDPAGVLANQLSIVDAMLQLQQADAAQVIALQAMIAAARLGEPEYEWQAARAMFRVLLALGRNDEAIVFGKEAVRISQSIRGDNRELDEGLQASYLERNRDVYETLVSTLLRAGRLAEAEQILKMLKLKEYDDFVRGSGDEATMAPTATGTEGQWTVRFRGIQAQLGELAAERAQIDAATAGGEPTVQQLARSVEVDSHLEDAARAFEAALAEMHADFAAAAPERIREIGARQLDETLQGMQGVLAELGPHVGLLQYVVAHDRLHILVTLPQVQFAREVAVTEAELDAEVLRFRIALRNPGSDPLPLARALYRRLLEPVRGDLDAAGVRTLMVSLDRSLRYIPLAALHSGSRWVAEDFAVAVYTAAAARNIQLRNAADWRVAGMGVSQNTSEFSPLPAVPFELDRIVRDETGTQDVRGVLPGVVRLDGDFTSTALTEMLRRGFPVVHIASHFMFIPGAGLESFLLMGDGSRLTLDKFKFGAFPLGKIDLLALSACETAMGETRGDGVEVEGFGALAQNKGAKGVIASLWSVADASTGVLMSAFYDLRTRGALDKAEALRRAQVSFIDGSAAATDVPAGLRRGLENGADAAPADPEKPFAHPFFWAPFVLMGNWL